MPNIEKIHNKTFESVKKTSEEGVEFWSAMELQVVLDYKEWRNFELVIEKARKSCENSGFHSSEHFVEINKIVNLGSNAERKINDIILSRYACYLITQNGDSKKPIIAMGQTYFAI